MDERYKDKYKRVTLQLHKVRDGHIIEEMGNKPIKSVREKYKRLRKLRVEPLPKV